MEETCEKRLYGTTSTFNLNDNSLPLVTKADDPRYQLSLFPSELKKKVETLLKMEVKKHSQHEACQRGDFPHINRQTTSSTNFDLNNVLCFYSFETEKIEAPQENEQQSLIKWRVCG